MKKVKKILTAAIAAAITLTATGVAASADNDITVYGPDATFYYHFAFAKMENLSDRFRYASAGVELRNRDTFEYFTREIDYGMIGKNDSVYIHYSVSKSTYLSVCNGIIHYGGSEHSPTEWSQREIL